MKAWIDLDSLNIAATEWDIRLYNLRKDGRAWAFQAKTDRKELQRRGAWSGKRTGSPCFHLMRDFIFGLFVLGASRVKTKMGDWTGVEEFKDDLHDLYYQNIGSLLNPVYLGESCDCDGKPGPSMSEQYERRRLTA